MSDLRRLEERYLNDPAFHAMVDTMRAVIERLQLAPSEVREAAMFAVYMTEMQNPRPSLHIGEALADELRAVRGPYR